MLQRKLNRLIPIGLMMLASGLILHNWVHGRYTEFAGGFLIGMAIVFMIAGIAGRSRGVTS
ncbi:MAG: hypothetical protein WCB05_09090 [Candidatus Sulfotelmatobacter sp.]